MNHVTNYHYNFDLDGIIRSVLDGDDLNKPSRKTKFGETYEDTQEEIEPKRLKRSNLEAIATPLQISELTSQELDAKIRIAAAHIFTAGRGNLAYSVLGKDNQGHTIGSWKFESFSGYFTVKYGIIHFSNYDDTQNFTGGIPNLLRKAVDIIFRSQSYNLYYSILQEAPHETIGCWQYGPQDGCFIATHKRLSNGRNKTSLHICKDNGSTDFISR